MGCGLEGDPVLSAGEVRRRFAWARRQGRPAWLWPDIAIADWRRALVQIEGATSAVLAGNEGVTLAAALPAIGLAGYTSGMGPLLGLWVEQGRLGVDDGVGEVLARHLAHNRIRTARMGAAACDLVETLAARGVEAVLLKGAHTGARYFPEPGARPASDIDLLVRSAEVPIAEAALGRGGLFLKSRGRWESSWDSAAARPVPRTLTYVHADDPWSVDLHGSLNIAAGAASPVADLDAAEPMRGFGGLDQPLLLLHLAAHAGAGWQNLTLLRQVELVLVIREDTRVGRLSWEAFLDVGGRTRALGYAYPGLRLCEVLAPGTVPVAVLERCADRAPAAVRRAIARMTPASAQRIDRSSLAEHFMWSPGWGGSLRQLASDILPDVRSWPELLGIYEERAWRLIRGRVSH